MGSAFDHNPTITVPGSSTNTGIVTWSGTGGKTFLDSTVLVVGNNITIPGTITFGGVAITSTAAELNILDGVTSTAAELNLLDGVSGLVQSDLTKLAAIDSTAAEINLLDALDRGSILYGNNSGVTTVLGQGGADTVLTSDGTDISWAAAASPTAIGCRVYRTSNQAFNNDATNGVNWQASRYHVSGDSNANMWNSGSNPEQVAARVAGTYLIIANWRWGSNSTGSRHARIKLNGTTDIALDYRPASEDNKITLSTIYQLGVGDYVGLYLLQTSGGALNLVNEANGATEFMVQRIADTITNTFV